MKPAISIVLVFWLVSISAAAPPTIADPVDRQIADAFLKHVDKSAVRCTPERMAKFATQPEDIVWQASYYVRMPLVAYRLTGDPEYLDAFVKRMDALCECLTPGPDGFLGWYGLPLELFRHPNHPDRKVDVILVGFEISGLMAEFARIVQGDDQLAARHGESVKRYLSLAEDHLIKKWHVRGCYRDLGTRGAVYTTHPDLKPTKGSLTQPHNKHAKIAAALVDLYAATGNDEYLVKAVKLGTRFKHCLTRIDDRYRWNYWDPAGPWDVNPDDSAKWKHWIGAEHRHGYYSLSVSQAVLLYEHGLVFDRADIDRFLKTQTDVCWNGDLENPKWARVDGRAADSRYLCTWLAPFDERIHELAFGTAAQQDRLQRKDHSWQGGVTACGWLEMKHVVCPKWSAGTPAETAAVENFLANASNQALLKKLSFEVDAPGYEAPMTPSQMKP